MKYVIGTRGSALAMAQAEYVQSRLAQAYPMDTFELCVIKTKGDLIQDRPLHEIGDKGLFVKDIEEKLLAGEIDIAVHSMKDMPAAIPAGLMLTKAWKRADPEDVLILRNNAGMERALDDVLRGAVVGTGSRRREFQLKRLCPDVTVVNIRGNIDTRLRKMKEQKLDGIVLAAAGIQRLGLRDNTMRTVAYGILPLCGCDRRNTQLPISSALHINIRYLKTDQMIPAPAQGILALEIRAGDKKLAEMLDAHSDEETIFEAAAERGFLEEMGGNCHVPVGAICQKLPDGSHQLHVMYGNASGTKQAYACAAGTQPEALAKEAAAFVRSQLAGTVYLVGAGPGDPDLITVKGLEAIRRADCIIYDRLSADELIKETKSGCEQIYVGKQNHHHTMEQEEINRLLVQKSMECETVVRLKGGDAYVFGRGGEEALFLKEHGVPFAVVPGISSCIAGPALAGIPVTHRGYASGFHVVTAHDKDDALADIDFKAMAGAKETCIFLMGLSMVKEIADRLMEAGMPADTKAAVISNAARPQQKTCAADLAHIADAVTREKLISPAVIIVGKTVLLREQLDFLKQRPLSQKRYLMPKVSKEPSMLHSLLQEQGASVDEIQAGQIITIRNEKIQAAELKKADWLIFTSKHGIAAFFENLDGQKLDARSLAGCRIAVIGHKTQACLKEHGIYADLIPEESHSGALAQALEKQLTGKETVWYIKAEHTGHHLQKALRTHCSLEEIVVYKNQTVKADLSRLRPLAEYDGILFTCASSVKRFMDICVADMPLSVPAYSIGTKTTACLKAYGVEKICEAARPAYEEIAKLCIKIAKKE